MKGLSPIIPVIALLVIMAVLAMSAFIILQGYNADSTSSSFRMESRDVSCTNVEGRNLISAQVTNLGKATLETKDFTFSQIDGIAFSVSQVSIPSGQSAIIQYDCGGQCASGSHTIVVGTSAGISTVNVQCP